MSEQAGWVETDSADGAAATATRAAPGDSRKQHVVYGVDASFSEEIIGTGGTADGILLQLKDGSTTKWEHYVSKSFTKEFSRGVTIAPGAACSAVLAAPGAGIVGKVNLHGVTR